MKAELIAYELRIYVYREGEPPLYLQQVEEVAI